MIQQKSNSKLLQYRQTVAKQVQNTLNNLSKIKKEQSDSLSELFNSLKKSVIRQIQRTQRKYISVIEQKISHLQSSLIQANKQILTDDLDVFTLQNVYRFTKRIISEADKSLINKFTISIQKLQKGILNTMKDIEIPQNTKISFTDIMVIDKVKNVDVESKPLGLGIVNNKLLVWGSDFYNYDNHNKNIKSSEILHVKSIKLYQKQYAMIVYKDYVDIEQPKNGVLMDRINGDFSNLISIISFDDIVYFIKQSSIIKLSLNTGALTQKSFPSRIIQNVSETQFLDNILVAFKFGQVGIINTNLDLIWAAKYHIQIENIIGIGQFIIICSKNQLLINRLYTTYFRKPINIQQICLIDPHNLLIFNTQAFILNLITFEQKQIKFKLNKRISSKIASNGTMVSMILSNDEVVVYKIE